MERKKLFELNSIALYLIKEIMKKKFEGVNLLSMKNHTSEDPFLGYSLGFSSDDLLSSLTLSLYPGDTFPMTSEALKRYHLFGVSDVLKSHPDLKLQDEDPKIEYYLGTDEMLGYMKTTLGEEVDHKDEHVIISTYFFDLLIKVKTTSLRRGNFSPEKFLKEFYQFLSAIFLNFNFDDPSSLLELNQ